MIETSIGYRILIVAYILHSCYHARGTSPPHDKLTYLHIKYMVFLMKTTLNIDDSVMQRLREEAARRGTTMSKLVEAGLRLVLSDSPDAKSSSVNLPPLPSWSSGGAKVDISNRDALYSAMEDE